MALHYYPQDEEVGTQVWRPISIVADTYDYAENPQAPGQRIDGITIAAVILLLFLGLRVVIDGRDATSVPLPDVATADKADQRVLPNYDSAAPPAAPELALDPSAIAYPYDNYVLTQGPHGYTYGHMAIDIAAGKGAAVKSPIDGTVTARYVDQWGNPTLVIENEVYQVTLLHGDYSVAVGDPLRRGQRVGTEGNNGYTTDMQGRLCAGRNCGYHTHLNIFDKRLGSNVNPLDVLGH